MRARWLLVRAVGLASLHAGPAPAQMPEGPFARLAPGNQRIARALHEAQRRDPPSGARRLSVDEIAARRSEQGWRGVFRERKARGLLAERSLTRLVDRHEVRASTR